MKALAWEKQKAKHKAKKAKQHHKKKDIRVKKGKRVVDLNDASSSASDSHSSSGSLSDSKVHLVWC